MALMTCPDCQGKVSDSAPACIHCGAPLQRSERRPEYGGEPKKMGLLGKTVLWLGGGFLTIIIIGAMNSSPEKDAARQAARKQACVSAMASSIGTSTAGYADKAAYEARVRDACDGFEINGKDLGRFGQ